MTYNPEKALWQEVLLRQIEDALTCPANVQKVHRVHAIEKARHYLTVPNPGFNTVCALAGVDPVAVRERLTKRIADAPTPADLVEANNKFANRKDTAPKAQARRTRKASLTFILDGRARSLNDLSEEFGISRETLRKRIEAGWSVRSAVNTPPRGKAPRPGVGSDFEGLEGTGGGRSAQDRPKITFSELELEA